MFQLLPSTSLSVKQALGSDSEVPSALGPHFLFTVPRQADPRPVASRTHLWD